MRTKSTLAWPIPSLKVAFASSGEMQELRITMRGSKPAKNLGHWGLNLGFVGGAEFAPWLSRWEVQEPSPLPNGGGSREYVYVVKVAAMSHRFIPHLVARIALNVPAGGVLDHLEIVGSLPMADPATSVTTAEIGPWLADLSTYPRAWPELGFPVEHAASLEHELGIQIEMAGDLDAKKQEALAFAFLTPENVFISFANDKGELMDPAKALTKRFPTLVKGRIAQVYIGNMRHAHGPSAAAWLNMLAKFHHDVAPIARVRLTSRSTPRAAGAKAQKENWFVWQLKGTLTSPGKKTKAAAKTPPAPAAVEVPAYRSPPVSAAHLGDRLPNGGLLESDGDGPALYAVLRGELYLEPLVPADVDGIRKATELLGAALGEHLRFSVNSKRGSKVVRHQAKHLGDIVEWVRILTGARDAGHKALAKAIFSGDFDGADVSFKGAVEGDDAAATASPWTVSFWSELGDEDEPAALARLTFSMPLDTPLTRFEALFAELASVLRVRWGNAGYGYAIWEYFGGGLEPARAHAKSHPGFDIGIHEGALARLQRHLRSVSWLTLLGSELWARVPDPARTAIKQRFAPAQLGNGVFVRASPQPELDGAEDYVALDALLRSVRLRGGIEDDVWSDADLAAWLSRFEG